MDVGEDSVGVRSVLPKLGDNRVGFRDVATKINSGPMGISRQWMRLFSRCTGCQR